MSYRSELIQVAAVAVAAIQNLDTGIDFSNDGEDWVRLREILKEIEQERENQILKWGPQNHTPEKWLVILMEEVGEAAKDVLEKNFQS